MKLTFAFAAIMVLAAAAHTGTTGAGQAPNGRTDITGTWTATFNTQIGEQRYTYRFVMSGAKLTGTAKSTNGESPIQDGKFDGKTVSFVENVTFQGRSLTFVYSGQLKSADEIAFTRTVDTFSEQLVAKRTAQH